MSTTISNVAEPPGTTRLSQQVAAAMTRLRRAVADAEKAACEILALERQLGVKPTLVPDHTPAYQKAVEIVARHDGVDPEMLTGAWNKRRPEVIARPRQKVMWLLRVRGLTYEAIGVLMGKDHGTIIHGCSVISNMMDVNEKMATQMNAMLAEMREGSRP